MGSMVRCRSSFKKGCESDEKNSIDNLSFA